MPRIKKAQKDQSAARKAGASKKTTSDSATATVTLDRRSGDRREGGDRRKASVPVAVERRKLERRQKVARRRQIDPTTCERDYSDDEVEFMNALDEYKRKSGRMFPTCSEVLEVLRDLGYQKLPKAPVLAEINPQLQPVSTEGTPAIMPEFFNAGEG